MRLNFWLFLAVTLLTLAAEAKPPIRFTVVNNAAMPLTGLDKNGKVQAGLYFELGNLIAAHFQTQPQFAHIPRKRVEEYLVNDKADVACYLNPKWIANKDSVLWSSVLFQNQTAIFRHHTAPKINQLSDLSGSTVGAMAGYYYPSLDSLFAGGKIKRDDSSRQENVHKKVVSLRNKYIVFNSLEHAYMIKTQPHLAKIFASDAFVLDTIDIHCALNKKSALTLEQLNAAIKEMIAKKQIDKVLLQYRN